MGLKDVFDQTHMKDTEQGKVYVNERAERVVVIYSLFLYKL